MLHGTVYLVSMGHYVIIYVKYEDITICGVLFSRIYVKFVNLVQEALFGILQSTFTSVFFNEF